MNTRVTEREHRLALALAEELAAAAGAVLDRAVAPDGPARPGAGWLLRWRVGGAAAGRLAAVIDEAGALALARRGADLPRDDEAVSAALADLADHLAGALGANPAVEVPMIAVDGLPARGVLEAGPAPLPFALDTPGGTRILLAARATFDAAPARPANEAAAAAASAPPAAPPNLGVILDLDLPLVVRFAQTSLSLQALSRLGPGSVLDLDRSPEEPVDVLVNGQRIARGQVVVAGGNYGVRITEVMSDAERIRVMAS